jgi:L-lysine exporter family protein LysE/ArgO
MVSLAQAVLYGFVWGFALCFTFGPAFFAIVQVSEYSSIKKGIVLSAGVVAADALLMFFGLFGTAMLPQIPNFSAIITVLGAVILFVMGLFSIFYTQGQLVYPKSTVGNFFYFFSKGLVLNLSNPANFLFVLSTIAYLRASFKYNNNQIVAFCVSAMVATFLAQLLIAFYAQKLKKTISSTLIKKISKIVGLAFIVLAIRMLLLFYLS